MFKGISVRFFNFSQNKRLSIVKTAGRKNSFH